MNTARKIVFIFLVLFTSCLDMLDKSSEKFMGNIYIRTSPNGKDKFLVYGRNYTQDGLYKPIIEDPILVAYGDSSIICAKSSFLDGINYYLVSHFKGDTIIDIKKIDSLYYSKTLLENKNIKQLH
jgi:hypothetical protein